MFDMEIRGVFNASVKDTLNAAVMYDGREILFNVSKYTRVPFKLNGEFHDPFKHTVKIIQSLPDELQRQIFNKYSAIMELFGDFSLSTPEMQTKLTSELSELVDLVEYDIVHEYVRSGVFQIPVNIKEEYDTTIDVNELGSRSQTYISQDYLHLVAYSIIMRLCLPVWGEYRYLMYGEISKTNMSTILFGFLDESRLIKTQPAIKLEQYISAATSSSKRTVADNKDLILSGITEYEIKSWVCSNVTVNRVTTCNIESVSADNIVTCIHRMISGILNPVINKSVSIKKHDDINSRDGTGISPVLEAYSIVSKLSIGAVEEIRWASNLTEHFIENAAPNLDPNVLENFTQTSMYLIDKNLTEVQVTILKWVIDPLIQARAVLHLTKKDIVRLTGIAQAILWHHNHKYLAILLGSMDMSNMNNNEMTLTTTSNSCNRIPKDKVKELLTHFPLHHNDPTNLDITITATTGYIPQVINSVYEKLVSGTWYSGANMEMLKEATGNESRTISNPSNLKILLADLLIDVGSNKWHKQ